MPAGTTVGFSSLITHRMPELYPQPDRFLPRRWEQIEPSAYKYFPFSGGARMCLGATFAMPEMKLVLPLIVQRYRLELKPEAKVDRSGLVFMIPKGGLPMRVRPQDRRFRRTEVRGNIHDWIELEIDD